MLHLVHQMDFLPPGDLAAALNLPAEQLHIPKASNQDGLAAAEDFCNEKNVFEGGSRFVAIPVLEPKLPAAVAKQVDKLKVIVKDVTEKLATQDARDPETGEDIWLRDFKAEIAGRAKDMTRGTRSCPDCLSTIAVKHIRAVECPVCFSEKFMMTATDQDRVIKRDKKLGGYRTTLAEANEKIETLTKDGLLNSTELNRTWAIFSQDDDAVLNLGVPVVVEGEVEGGIAGEEAGETAGGENAGEVETPVVVEGEAAAEVGEDAGAGAETENTAGVEVEA